MIDWLQFIITAIAVLVVLKFLGFIGGNDTPSNNNIMSNEPQAVPVRTEKPTGETPVYQNVKNKGKLLESLDGMTTLAQIYEHSLKTYPTRPFLGWRTKLADGKFGGFQWKTYQEVDVEVRNFIKGITALTGLKAKENVGFYSNNRVEWKVSEIACWLTNSVVVSLYDTLAPDAASFILKHAEIRIVVASGAVFNKLAQALKQNKLMVEYVVLFDRIADITPITSTGVKVIFYDDVIAKGVSISGEPQFNLPTANDLCSIMYTSGTTGEPKGAMISHLNVVAFIGGVTAFLDPKERGEDVIHLSFLPLAHMMERVGQATTMYRGGCAGFYSGDVKNLVDDFATLQPTTILGAPRLYQKIHDKIIAGVEHAGGIKKFLFYTAYNAKKAALARGSDTPFWNRLVFNKLKKQIFGLRATVIVSGSAPLSNQVGEFLRIVFSVPVVEGYGLTETTAGCSLQNRTDPLRGRVGPPTACCEFKLVDVPDMKYMSTDKPFPRGEVCIRGPSLCLGYYKNKEKTDEAWKDGWFFSGDIGQVNADGTLSIIDRKKNIFKLSFGEYVAPENLENIFCRSTLVAQCYVHGDSTQPFLVAVVVPEEETVMKWASDNRIQATFQELCSNPKLNKAILDDIAQVARAAKCNSYELPKAAHLDPVPFSVDNGILTPTLKLKRNDARAYYKNQLTKMIDEVAKQLESEALKQ